MICYSLYIVRLRLSQILLGKVSPPWLLVAYSPSEHCFTVWHKGLHSHLIWSHPPSTPSTLPELFFKEPSFFPWRMILSHLDTRWPSFLGVQHVTLLLCPLSGWGVYSDMYLFISNL